jgi:hypothetical protein
MTVLITSLDRTRSTGTKLSTTNATAVYTVPATGVAMAKGVGMRLCNVDGTSAVDVTIEWFDKSANVSYKLASTKSLAADTSEAFDLMGLALDPEDEIRVTAGAADDLHVVTTILESFGRA